MIGGGRDNAVLNNLVVDCPIGLHLDSRGMTWKQWNNPADKSWCLAVRRPSAELHPTAVEHSLPASGGDHGRRTPPAAGQFDQRNVFVNCSKQVCSFDGNVKKLLDKLDLAENLGAHGRLT